MTILERIKDNLTFRLEAYERLIQEGLEPGDLDSIELERLIGRIKELKYVLNYLDMLKALKVKETQMLRKLIIRFQAIFS